MTPNPLPRPPEELATLERLWEPPTGWRRLSVVNNTWIGTFYLGAALLFLILGGVLALLMRTQLAVPENDLIGADLYNQLFTMHGSVMMFLFAVPVVEAIAVLLLPAMLGARDLPFPRLSAYAFWAYFAGGLGFYATLFVGLAPDGGWFMYPPLTSYEYSPGLRADFWLLGIGFIEISAIAGAVEIVVGILRTRPPGMTLERMPMYAWAMLVTGGMIVFAFPAVILATALLELERAFHWPFFIAERGGDPVLWQHLFWLFGHPDVYIIFLPAAGIVSMVLPTIARVRLVGYRWLVVALLATGVISFALWVHHMFAAGVSHHAAAFVSAASMAIAIPAGVQVFSWLATLHRGKVRFTTPAWFMLAFFGVFVLGGLTGVMVAVVPYDWQVHDTYFVVAHLHYVLIGGMLLPVFAALYYWYPLVTGSAIRGPWGKAGCAIMFVGINLTFFPMHIAGLLGMPRRVWTYAAGLGWELWNLLATIGAFVLAAGVAMVCVDLARNFRMGGKVDTDPWGAGTLEWLPADSYGIRSIPAVTSREPLWDNPALREEVAAGAHYLPGSVTGDRETLVTSPVGAHFQYLLRLPGPSWLPITAGLCTAVFFFALTLKLVVISVLAGALTVAAIWRWLWEAEPQPTGRLHAIGGGVELPDHPPGRPEDGRSHAAWGLIVMLVVNATIFACLAFSFLYLRGVSPGWKEGVLVLPPAAPLAGVAMAWVAGGALIEIAARWLRPDVRSQRVIRLLTSVALVTGLIAMATHVQVLILSNPEPSAHAHGAMLWTICAWQGVHAVLLAFMTVFFVARSLTGRVAPDRRASLDNLQLVWRYSVIQAVAGVLLSLVPAMA